MFEKILEVVAEGAWRIAAPKAADAFQDMEEMNDLSKTLGHVADPANAWEEGVETAERIERVTKPLFTARALFRALRPRR